MRLWVMSRHDNPDKPHIVFESLYLSIYEQKILTRLGQGPFMNREFSVYLNGEKSNTEINFKSITMW